MLRPSHGLIHALFLAAIVAPFNNCDRPTSTMDSGSPPSIGSSGGVQVALSGVGDTVYIPPDVQVFSLSGTCDTRAYPNSTILWLIHTVQGQFVMDSFSAGGTYFTSGCAGGHFQIQVRVPCPGLVNVGNGCFGLTQAYQLRIRLVGMNADGSPNSNAQATSAPLNLLPGSTYAAKTGKKSQSENSGFKIVATQASPKDSRMPASTEPAVKKSTRDVPPATKSAPRPPD